MPLILETPDESRWAEEIAELKRFWEEQSNGCDSLSAETAVSAEIFVRISIRKFVNQKRIQYLWIGV